MSYIQTSTLDEIFERVEANERWRNHQRFKHFTQPESPYNLKPEESEEAYQDRLNSINNRRTLETMTNSQLRHKVNLTWNPMDDLIVDDSR